MIRWSRIIKSVVIVILLTIIIITSLFNISITESSSSSLFVTFLAPWVTIFFFFFFSLDRFHKFSFNEFVGYRYECCDNFPWIQSILQYSVCFPSCFLLYFLFLLDPFKVCLSNSQCLLIPYASYIYAVCHSSYSFLWFHKSWKSMVSFDWALYWYHVPWFSISCIFNMYYISLVRDPNYSVNHQYFVFDDESYQCCIQ